MNTSTKKPKSGDVRMCAGCGVLVLFLPNNHFTTVCDEKIFKGIQKENVEKFKKKIASARASIKKDPIKCLAHNKEPCMFIPDPILSK